MQQRTNYLFDVLHNERGEGVVASVGDEVSIEGYPLLDETVYVIDINSLEYFEGDVSDSLTIGVEDVVDLFAPDNDEDSDSEFGIEELVVARSIVSLQGAQPPTGEAPINVGVIDLISLEYVPDTVPVQPGGPDIYVDQINLELNSANELKVVWNRTDDISTSIDSNAITLPSTGGPNREEVEDWTWDLFSRIHIGNDFTENGIQWSYDDVRGMEQTGRIHAALALDPADGLAIDTPGGTRVELSLDIGGLDLIDPAVGDHVIIGDASDGNLPKRSLISSLMGTGTTPIRALGLGGLKLEFDSFSGFDEVSLDIFSNLFPNSPHLEDVIPFADRHLSGNPVGRATIQSMLALAPSGENDYVEDVELSFDPSSRDLAITLERTGSLVDLTDTVTIPGGVDTNDYVDTVGLSRSGNNLQIRLGRTGSLIDLVDTVTLLAPNPGDITGVTAGLGLDGGGSAGSITIGFDPDGLTIVEPEDTDYVVIADTSDNGEPKRALVSGFVPPIPTLDLSWLDLNDTPGDYSIVEQVDGQLFGTTSFSVTTVRAAVTDEGDVYLFDSSADNGLGVFGWYSSVGGSIPSEFVSGSTGIYRAYFDPGTITIFPNSNWVGDIDVVGADVRLSVTVTTAQGDQSIYVEGNPSFVYHEESGRPFVRLNAPSSDLAYDEGSWGDALPYDVIGGGPPQGPSVTVTSALNTIGGSFTVSFDWQTQDTTRTVVLSGYLSAVNNAGNGMTLIPSPAGIGAEFIRDTVADFIVQGTGISVVHADTANRLTITNTGSGGGTGDNDYVDDVDLSVSGSLLTLRLGRTSPLGDLSDTVTLPTGGGLGDITAVNTPNNSGLSGGVTSGEATLELDVNNLSSGTPVLGDYLPFSDQSLSGDPTRRATIQTILSLGSGGGSGDITAVTAGVGLAGGGTAGGVTLDLDINELTVGSPVVSDYLPFSDESLGGDPTRRAQISTVLALAGISGVDNYADDLDLSVSGSTLTARLGRTGSLLDLVDSATLPSGSGGGVDTFLELTDAPDSYTESVEATYTIGFSPIVGHPAIGASYLRGRLPPELFSSPTFSGHAQALFTSVYADNSADVDIRLAQGTPWTTNSVSNLRASIRIGNNTISNLSFILQTQDEAPGFNPRLLFNERLTSAQNRLLQDASSDETIEVDFVIPNASTAGFLVAIGPTRTELEFIPPNSLAIGTSSGGGSDGNNYSDSLELTVVGTSLTATIGRTGTLSDLSDSVTLPTTGGGSGDITAVTAGIGLAGGGTTGAITLDLDVNELSVSTPVLGDYLPFSDESLVGDPTRRATIQEVLALGGVSGTDNYVDDLIIGLSGSTLRVTIGRTGTLSNLSDTVTLPTGGGTGDITAVNTPFNSGLSGGVISGVATLLLDIDNLLGGTPSASDYLAFSDQTGIGDPTHYTTIASILNLADIGSGLDNLADGSDPFPYDLEYRTSLDINDEIAIRQDGTWVRVSLGQFIQSILYNAMDGGVPDVGDIIKFRQIGPVIRSQWEQP